jgi:hypothetical protein
MKPAHRVAIGRLQRPWSARQDDVLDLFDLLVTRMLVDAVRKGREARLRSLRDLATPQRSP